MEKIRALAIKMFVFSSSLQSEASVAQDLMMRSASKNLMLLLATVSLVLVFLELVSLREGFSNGGSVSAKRSAKNQEKSFDVSAGVWSRPAFKSPSKKLVF